MNNRAGYYKQNLSGEMAYKSFVPNPLPPVPPIELSEDIVGLLVKANSQLAVLESIAARIPNVELFISMYVRKEALMSSQIEGTQATFRRYFRSNAGYQHKPQYCGCCKLYQSHRICNYTFTNSSAMQPPD